MAEWERSKGNEATDPFGLRSAMQRKMAERGDDPASRARAQAEADSDTEVSDDEIADLLGPRPPEPDPGDDPV